MSKKKRIRQNKGNEEAQQSAPVATPTKRFFDMPIYAAIGIFILTTLIFFWDVIFGNAYFWEDIVRFVYPLQNFAATSSAAGSIPHWNPYTFSGMPFLADLQVGFFYPLNRVLNLFIGSDGVLSFSALQLMIILHFFIAQINTYLFAKSFKMSSIASIIVAIGYSFSMLMTTHSIHPMIVQHLAWFPLVLLFFFKAVRFGKVKYASIAGIIYGMSMLAGHTQMALYEALFMFISFVYAYIVGIKDKKLKGNARIWSPVSAALTIAIAAGIFMVQYEPTNTLVPHSKRSDSSYEFVTQGSLEYKQLFTGVMPKLFGTVNGNMDMTIPYHLEGAQSHNYWETSFYFGVGILLLGLFGFLTNLKRRDMQLMLIIAVFGVLFALGKNFFLFDIFYNLPFFGLFRNPARIMFFTVLAFSFAAGIGFDTLYQREFSNSLRNKLFIAMGVVVLLGFFGGVGVYASMFNTPEQFVSDVNATAWVAVLFALIVGALAFAGLKAKSNSLLVASLVIVAVFADLYIASADFNKSDTDATAMYRDFFQQNPDVKKMLTPNMPSDPFRVKMRLYDQNGRTIARPLEDNQGMIDRIFLFEGYNPLLLSRMIIPIANPDLSLSMKNIRYELKIHPEEQQLYFAKNDSAFSPAWFVYNKKVIPTETLTKASEKNDFSVLANIDFRNEVVIEKNNKIQLSGKQQSEVNHYAKVLKYENNAITYEASSDENAMLCFSEMYYPEWKAFIDGKETEIYAANYGFRAIDFPAGKHKIEMIYQPDAYESGKAISLLSLLAGILIFATSFFWEKSKLKKAMN